MKTIVASGEESLERACALAAGVLREKPEAVLALSAADDCLALLERLGEKGVSLAAARLFSIAEFENLDEDAPQSCRSRLRGALSRTDAREENCCFLSAENAGSIDDRIAAAGGLDLAILGLGLNARIGFNEPATPFDSRAHRQKLAPSSRRELAALFGGEEQVPVYGVTLGIRTLTEAREILVVASGEERARAVFKMLYGRDDSFVPAAFLQIPPNVTVCLDEQAAGQL